MCNNELINSLYLYRINEPFAPPVFVTRRALVCPAKRTTFSRCSPAVLVPGLDLGVGEVERGRELHAILHT